MHTSRKPWFIRWLWTVLCHNRAVGFRGRRAAAPVGNGEMSIMCRKPSAATYAVVMILVLAAVAAAETSRKEYHFKVGRKTSVSIVNPYGPVSVKAGPAQASDGYGDSCPRGKSRLTRAIGRIGSRFSPIFWMGQTRTRDVSSTKSSCRRMRA